MRLKIIQEANCCNALPALPVIYFDIFSKKFCELREALECFFEFGFVHFPKTAEIHVQLGFIFQYPCSSFKLFIQFVASRLVMGKQ